MSLILKGIDLPEYINKPLRIEVHADGHVWIDHGTDYEYIDDVAVQIPKGHEKILDSKYLLEPLTDLIEKEGLDPWCEVAAIIDLIEDAPYYLEAEE